MSQLINAKHRAIVMAGGGVVILGGLFARQLKARRQALRFIDRHCRRKVVVARQLPPLANSSCMRAGTCR